MNGLLSQPQKCVCCCQGYVSWVCCLHHLHPGDIMNTCRNCIIWCKRTTMNQAWYHLFNLHPAFKYLSCYLIFLLILFFWFTVETPNFFFRVTLPCLETNPCFQSNVMGIIFAISIILSGFIISKKPDSMHPYCFCIPERSALLSYVPCSIPLVQVEGPAFEVHSSISIHLWVKTTVQI